jgi:tRNA-dihydrouridine synthase
MKEPERAAAIVREMRRAVEDRVPITVKIRLGWSDPDEFKKFIPVVEEAGVSLITVHGRTKAQGYSGKSDWMRIGEAKKIARVPLLANGDIHEPYQVAEALEVTGADGVLIARGALGNPWFFQLANQAIQAVSLEERVAMVLEHARLHVAQYGERGLPAVSLGASSPNGQSSGREAGIVSFRKHLSWYFKTNKIGFEIPGLKEFREKLVRVNSLDELETILRELLMRVNVPSV